MVLEYYLYYVYYTFLGLPFIIRVSILALSIIIPLYLLNGYIFLAYRKKYYQAGKIRKYLDEKYREKLESIVTSESHLLSSDFDRLLDGKIKKLKKKEKMVLTRLLSSICKDSPFINYENNQNLLDYLKIRHFWEKKLKHGNAKQKQDSLRSLDDLQARVSGAVLTDLTYSRNESLRKRSRSSYLRFTRNDPFKFLEEGFDKNLNNWDKIELHHILEKREKKGGLPNLARWVLCADNLYFQCFMVDEIAYFNQKESAAILVDLVKEAETNSILRMHCINAFGKMKCQEVEPELLKSYPIQPSYVQTAIIQSVGIFNTGKSLPFLIEAYQNADDDEERLMILSVIYNYGVEGQEYFREMEQKQKVEDFSSLMFKHVSNPLLSTN